eukprot:g1022.t1
MDKLASDTALNDAAARISRKETDLELSQREIRQLRNQVYKLNEIRNSVARLQKATRNHARTKETRNKGMAYLKKEQEYFRQRQQGGGMGAKSLSDVSLRTISPVKESPIRQGGYASHAARKKRH